MSLLFTNSQAKLVLRSVPETSMTRYIGGYSALNLHMPDTSGDWHQWDYIYCPENEPHRLNVFGDGTEKNRNSNHIFGDFGIIESANDLKSWGFEVNYPQVFRSNHFRAILDLLYYDLMNYRLGTDLPFPSQGATVDFLDTEEQQQIIFNKALSIQPYLPPERTALLDRWIIVEKKYEDY